MIGKIELLLATHTKDFTASNQTCTLYTITISLFRNPTVGLDANRSTGYGVVCKAILVFSLAEAKQYKAQDQFKKNPVCVVQGPKYGHFPNAFGVNADLDRHLIGI